MGDAESAPAASARSRRDACEQIAGEAATLLRSRFGNPGVVRGKGVADDLERLYDVVTELDDLSEALVLRRIAELNPDALVLAEEGGYTAADGTRTHDEDPEQVEELWLVDPLDGTVNFAHGVPHFCVSVACWRRGVPYAGAIVDPMVGETFSFERESSGEQGAWHDSTRVDLGEGPAPHEALVYVGGSGSRLTPLLRGFRSWRRLGSAALALAWTGTGRCGAYVQPGMLHPWDWAVGVPFVEAAGGVVTDADGRPWTNRLAGTTGVIAASRGMHREVVGWATAE